MKRLITLLLLFCFVPTSLAQGLSPEALHKSTDGRQHPTKQPCTLKVAESPELRGFKLDMDLAEIRAKFPRLPIRAVDEVGRSSIRVIPGISAGGVDTSGVRYIAIDLLDEAVTSISVHYDNSVTWENVAEFTEAISKSLKLPPDWEGGRDGLYRRRLTCDGFTVEANYLVSDAGLVLSINDAEEVIEKRREERKKKQQKEFKP